MFKVTVKISSGGVIDFHTAETRAECDAWVAERRDGKNWEKLEPVTVEITDITAEIEAEKVKAEQLKAKILALSAFKGKNLTSSEIKQTLEMLLGILFDENSSLAAELFRFAARTKGGE